MFLAPFPVNELLDFLVQCTASWGCKERIELHSKCGVTTAGDPTELCAQPFEDFLNRDFGQSRA
jgi:hypothetical protein